MFRSSRIKLGDNLFRPGPRRVSAVLTAMVFAVTTILVGGPARGASVPQAAESAATTTAASTSSGAITTAGTDFWVTIPPNFADGFTYDLFVSGAAATSGTVTDPGDPPVGFSITPGHVTSLTVTGVIPSASRDGVVDEGIHVVAGSPVTVYGLNLARYSSDAFTSLPTAALGTRYRVASYTGDYSPSRLSVLATAAGTTVTVTPSVTVGARTEDVPYTVSLGQGQVYTLATPTGDLSGSLVTSNHPVAVWGSVDCGSVDVGGNSGACDIMMQELPPTSSWGSDFLAVRYLKASFGDPYRIFADTNDTTVTVDGTVVGTIARAGGYLDGVYGVPGTGAHPDLDVGVHIQTSHPAMIIQYQTGGSYAEGADTTVSGDPSMMLVPPTQQYLASYTIATPPTQFVVNDVNVTVPTADIASLRLNGRSVRPSAFVPIVGTTFSGAQLPLPLGSSTLTDRLPFGAFVYGENDYNSYAYPGGYSVASIASVSSLVATSPVRATVGSQVCIPVTVEDSSHHPVAGIRVDAAVGGANPTAAFAVSSADGVASVCYPANRVGTDTVRLSVGSIGTTVTVEVVSSAAAPSAPPGCPRPAR